jgi:hypothetical protein
MLHAAQLDLIIESIGRIAIGSYFSAKSKGSHIF